MKKRDKIIKTASRLFAEQGYDGISTLQIAIEAGVTEPLIFYYFKGKDGLFTVILTAVFERLFEKLDALIENAPSPFETIERLIAVHFEMLKAMPLETAVAIRACPAKLKDSVHVCAGYVQGRRDRLKSLLTECVKKGVESGEFRKVPVAETVNILIALINGLMRQQVTKLDKVKGVRDAAVSFCRRSLVNHEIDDKCEFS